MDKSKIVGGTWKRSRAVCIPPGTSSRPSTLRSSRRPTRFRMESSVCSPRSNSTPSQPNLPAKFGWPSAIKPGHPGFPLPPVRLTRMSGPAFHFGVNEHTISGATLRVFNPAKTVADCFKFRNKIGLDVAIEAQQLSRKTGNKNQSKLQRKSRRERE
jgi:hypothetical protein